ncbi:Pyrimidine/purine nucleoside phosphorylase [Vibrio stylophorae]|uniref:Pyrimidine/purine nucleoside phosphorylase n=1 Tax=Vibrio stylophorae TaxID=659351 RepID=A0ABM8ZR51_9VIBR|nr:pyrimidine/purine nucleoside phosphorylase [Vibrio stylophorae]CAH0532380.1 Pyrimidine/purine nucleoside phosphorylase [Vibrio stylophorae]
MIQHNRYFEDQVQSLGFEQAQPLSVGVMATGEYRFTTAAAEVMTVVRGNLTILLAGASEWQSYDDGQSFNVPENSYFDVKVAQPTAYLCEYAN